MLRSALLAALIAAGLLFSSEAPLAQTPSRLEVIPFQSRTLTGEEFLRADAPGRDVTLAGELRLPPGSVPTQKVPAVVLVHGSGGLSGSADLWARELNGAGVAAFVLDSFSGRGIVSTVADQNQLSSLAMMVDAYRALDLLAAHPRIRADRIAVIGFSKGAVAALYSATERFARSYGGPQHRFAAHIGLYTPCNVTYGEDAKVTRAPIRLFHGVADDYVPVAPCRDYVARLREAGADVTLTEYPGAHHGFDNPLSPAQVSIPNAQTTRNCRLAEGPGGAIRNAGTGAPYAIETDPCVEKGAHVGHHPEATAAVRAAVKDIVREALLR